jgi:quercetin dioxygenase-like cupin family protein
MVKKINSIVQKEIIPGFKGRLVHAENFTIAFWEIEAGSILPEHKHINEQSTQLTKGILELTINGETHILNEGDIVVIPPNVIHKGKALTYCEITDTFCPTREDYK